MLHLLTRSYGCFLLLEKELQLIDKTLKIEHTLILSNVNSSVGIFGATSNLTTGIGSNTVVNVGDLGRGIKTNKVVLSGFGNTAQSAIVNPAGISTCPGITCSGLASSVTTLTSQLNALEK